MDGLQNHLVLIDRDRKEHVKQVAKTLRKIYYVEHSPNISVLGNQTQPNQDLEEAKATEVEDPGSITNRGVQFHEEIYNIERQQEIEIKLNQIRLQEKLVNDNV